MIPSGESLELPSGISIPTVVKTFDEADAVRQSTAYVPHWLKTDDTDFIGLPRKFSPSSAEPLVGAKIGRIIELGERLPLDKVGDMALLGSAIHGVIAACISKGQAIAIEKVQALLVNFGVEESLSAQNALQASQRFIDYINKHFDIERCLVEYPVSALNELGQEATGFIDLVIETPKGWVIIDHKSSPTKRGDWQANSIKYSGQLDVYRRAIKDVSDKPVLECWIHFALTGGLVEVVFDEVS
jgi:ATP-dependent exoDNAse (exonuclease V) beta subunit